MKMSFYDLFERKRTDMNQKKPTIASTTSELSDGLRKNSSFMPKYIENVPKLCVWLQLIWVVMQHLSFSQSKLSKRFQFQTNEISNFIVASLDIRFSFSTSQNRKNDQSLSFLTPRNEHFFILFCHTLQVEVAFQNWDLPRNFPQIAKSLKASP